MQKIRILHVLTELRKGGGQKFLLDVCHELTKHEDISFLIVVLDQVNEYPDLTKDLPIIHCRVNFKLSVIRKNYFEITEFNKIVQEFDPHIIHSHLYLAEIVSRISIMKSCKYFTHLQGFEDRFRPFSFKIFTKKMHLTNFYEKWWLINRYLKSNNYFFAISKNTELYYQKLLPSALKDHIFFLPNAVPIQRYLVKQPRKTDLTKLRLISVGSLDKRKNHEFLLKVAELLLKKNADFEFEILGEGIERPALEESIKNKGLTGKVFLLGNIIEVENYLHQANVYIHAAPYEPFGLVIIEAMAAGLPVVSLNGLGNKDLIINDYNGYLIKTENVELFAEKLLKVFEDQERYHLLSANAVTFAKQYDISNCVSNMIKYYEQVLQKN